MRRATDKSSLLSNMKCRSRRKVTLHIEGKASPAEVGAWWLSGVINTVKLQSSLKKRHSVSGVSYIATTPRTSESIWTLGLLGTLFSGLSSSFSQPQGGFEPRASSLEAGFITNFYAPSISPCLLLKSPVCAARSKSTHSHVESWQFQLLLFTIVKDFEWNYPSGDEQKW